MLCLKVPFFFYKNKIFQILNFFFLFVIEQSPNPEESIYFDAVTNGGTYSKIIEQSQQQQAQVLPIPSTVQTSSKTNEPPTTNDDNLKIQHYKLSTSSQNVIVVGSTSSSIAGSGADDEVISSNLVNGQKNEAPLENNQNPKGVVSCYVNLRNSSAAPGPNSGGGISSGSKIPIFNPNLRISKCASWAGGTDYLSSHELNDLTPGKEQIIKFN